MADIEKSVRLFNAALPLAVAKLGHVPLSEHARLGARLSQLVRSSIRAGLDDPKAIAEAAVAALE